jgi:hypothetical protein
MKSRLGGVTKSLLPYALFEKRDRGNVQPLSQLLESSDRAAGTDINLTIVIINYQLVSGFTCRPAVE